MAGTKKEGSRPSLDKRRKITSLSIKLTLFCLGVMFGFSSFGLILSGCGDQKQNIASTQSIGAPKGSDPVASGDPADEDGLDEKDGLDPDIFGFHGEEQTPPEPEKTDWKQSLLLAAMLDEEAHTLSLSLSLSLSPVVSGAPETNVSNTTD